MLGPVRGIVLTVGSRVSPHACPQACVPARAAAWGQFLTEHDNVALEEGTSEDKANFIRVVGFDESWLRVIETLGPVLKLIEVHRCASICRNTGRGLWQAGMHARRGSWGWSCFPTHLVLDAQTHGWDSLETKGDLT